MKRMNQTLAVIIVAALTLSACSGQKNAENARAGGITGGGGLSKQDVGTGLGAIGGAVAGAQFGKGDGKLVTTALGALLGAGIGNSIGASLDRADMTFYQNTQQKALETSQAGQALPWSNPQSGNSGVIIPQAPFQNQSGQYCREFQNKITVGGKTESGYGTACRQPDGSWQIVSQ
jgi:surface antigen